MRIRIMKEKRKTIAYSLAPEELSIILPNDEVPEEQFNSLIDAISMAKVGSGHHRLVTREELQELLRRWIDNLQVRPNRAQVRYMRDKWASCSQRKNITFNSLLTNMPKEFVEYVICHELLHLKVPRHNKLFRSLLSAYMPDWKERVTRTMEFVLHKELIW